MNVTVSIWFILIMVAVSYWFGYFVCYITHKDGPFGKILIEKSTKEDINDLISFQLAGDLEDLYSMNRVVLMVEVKEGRNDNSVNDKD